MRANCNCCLNSNWREVCKVLITFQRHHLSVVFPVACIATSKLPKPLNNTEPQTGSLFFCEKYEITINFSMNANIHCIYQTLRIRFCHKSITKIKNFIPTTPTSMIKTSKTYLSRLEQKCNIGYFLRFDTI